MITTWPISDVTTLDTTHKRLHEGRFFSGGYYNSSLADTGVLEIVIQSSATIYSHLSIEASSSGNCIVELFSGATFSAAGTSITMSNHNRNSAKSFSGTVTHTPTLTANGTQINGTGFLAAGQKGDGFGVFEGFTGEFLLALSTTYLIRITNVSGGAAKVSSDIRIYQPNL